MRALLKESAGSLTSAVKAQLGEQASAAPPSPPTHVQILSGVLEVHLLVAKYWLHNAVLLDWGALQASQGTVCPATV